ncbi:MAG: S41 family peptidase [Acidimicrobiales bacterium]
MPVDLATAPVAIVQSNQTASAHEFAVMALSGRRSSRTLGTSTRGLPTARSGFEMKDGSVLYLTTALVWTAAGRFATLQSLPTRGSRAPAPAHRHPTTPTRRLTPHEASAASDNVCALPRRPGPPLAASSSSPQLRLRLPRASLRATTLTRRGQGQRHLTRH